MKRFTTASILAVLVTLAVSGVAPTAVAEEPIKGVAVAPKVPSKRRLAHVAMNEVTVIAAQKGWLQEEFAKLNADVDLVNTSSYGSSGTQAALYDRGDLHIGNSMLNGSMQNRVQGLDIAIIWLSVKGVPRRAVTSVLENSPYKTPADLKGKTLGGSITGCPYYAAIESLRSKGVTVDNEFRKGDLRFMNISGAASTSAFLAGQYDALATHPVSIAALYVQKQVREIAQAVPEGNYLTTGGRTAWSASTTFARDNPDLVQAFLTSFDRTVRWLYSDNKSHLDEAARIVARELRQPSAVARFDLKDDSEYAYDYGVTDYKEALFAVKGYQDYNIANKDPFFTKHSLTQQEIDSYVDPRFFRGGAYFVDVGPKN